MNKELLVAIVLLLAILIGCGIQQSIDANKPLPPMSEEDYNREAWEDTLIPRYYD